MSEDKITRLAGTSVTAKTMGRMGIDTVDPLTFVHKDASTFVRTLTDKPLTLKYLTRNDFAGATDMSTIWLDGKLVQDDTIELGKRADIMKGILLDEVGHVLWTKLSKSECLQIYRNRRDWKLPFAPGVYDAVVNLLEDHYNVTKLTRTFPGFEPLHYETIAHYIDPAKAIARYFADVVENNGRPSVNGFLSVLILAVKSREIPDGFDLLEPWVEMFTRGLKLHSHKRRAEYAVQITEEIVRTFMDAPEKLRPDEPDSPPETEGNDQSDQTNDPEPGSGDPQESDEPGDSGQSGESDESDDSDESGESGGSGEPSDSDDSDESADSGGSGESGDSDDTEPGDPDSGESPESDGEGTGNSDEGDESPGSTKGTGDSEPDQENEGNSPDSGSNAQSGSETSVSDDAGVPTDASETPEPPKPVGNDEFSDIEDIVRKAGVPDIEKMDDDDPTRQNETPAPETLTSEEIYGVETEVVHNPNRPIGRESLSRPIDKTYTRTFGRRLKVAGSDKGGWVHGYKSGTIRPHGILKVATKQNEAFSKYESREYPDMDVAIVQDRSSSLRLADHAIICRLVDIITAGLESVEGINVMNVTFSTRYGNVPQIVVTKETGKRPKFNACEGPGPRGATPTAQSMVVAGRLLSKRAESRKLMILITDGKPNSEYGGNDAVHQWVQENRGIEVIQVLVGRADGAEIINTVKIEKLNESAIGRVIQVVNRAVKNTRRGGRAK